MKSYEIELRLDWKLACLLCSRIEKNTMFDSNDVRINQQETRCKESLIQRYSKIGVLRKPTKNRTSYMTRGGVIFAMWNHYIEVKKIVPNPATVSLKEKRIGWPKWISQQQSLRERWAAINSRRSIGKRWQDPFTKSNRGETTGNSDRNVLRDRTRYDPTHPQATCPR